MTQLRAGLRLRSAVCATEVVVVRAPKEPATDLRCGGHPMLAVPGGGDPEVGLELIDDRGTVLGKRYEDPRSGLKLLAIKAGAGGLTVAGDPLPVEAAKSLPSSD